MTRFIKHIFLKSVKKIRLAMQNYKTQVVLFSAKR